MTNKEADMTAAQFVEWNKAIDKLAKEYRPTRNRRPNIEDFMRAVELMFKANGWDFNQFSKQAYLNWAANANRK